MNFETLPVRLPMIFKILLLTWLVSAGVEVRACGETRCRLPVEQQTPRLILIGDSTVKNGRGNGDGGLWGWGQVLADHFELQQIVIENRALGGRSSRTYRTEGLWEKSLARLRPGDFLMIQFGHNDGGKMFRGDRPRASIKGNGEETKEGVVQATGKKEIVHSYGWYLRQYVAEAKQKGAIPIILSPVPRNRWDGGHVLRADADYGLWARQAAEQSGAAFIDFNDQVAMKYESLGKAHVGQTLFTMEDWTHTTEAGARCNASVLVDAIRNLQDNELKLYLKTQSSSR